MAGRDVLMDWTEEALIALNGSASLLDVAKKIWDLHEADLTNTELFIPGSMIIAGQLQS